ncbi:MAG: DUF4846 domain-containing protein [Flavobacteriaceae bacterium]|nr:DUF4846 domain-containing protein [Flavobacteriaceae bacterium]
MKRILLLIGVIVVFLFGTLQVIPLENDIKQLSIAINVDDHINRDQLTIASRVKPPQGYKRLNYPEGSFQNYLRNYLLKPFGTVIVNYDGSEYYWQQGHIGILDIPVPKHGLQQCADALIRVRSEYLWEQNRKDEIGFNFTSGHYCSWLKYAEGYRPIIQGNKVTFHKTASMDSSKTNFYKYLNLIYLYSGTLSLYEELPKINNVKNLEIGDMLIKGGSPGHVAIICDEVINESGEKLFLLFQGNTPAQSVHLVKNLEDTSISPWYQLKKDALIPVSNYTFYDSKFVRFK